MIRKANILDIPDIHRLLAHYGRQGALLARPLSELYDHLRDFWVWAGADGRIVGCCALQFCWEDMAEIRSLAVAATHAGNQIGRSLLEAAIAEARSYGILRLFTLTYEPDFFKKRGFAVIDRADLPLKIWGDCIACVKFPHCDETAMAMDLAPAPDRIAD